MNAACTGALYAAKRSRTHTRWTLQPLRMPKARTVRVVTPPEPQAGPPLLKTVRLKDLLREIAERSGLGGSPVPREPVLLIQASLLGIADRPGVGLRSPQER